METESQCCGNATYDESTQECCEFDLDPARYYSVRTRLPGHNYRCCGPRVIDVEFEECPGEGLASMDDDDGPVVLGPTCGTSHVPYNPLRQICCEGKLACVPGFPFFILFFNDFVCGRV